MSYSASGIANVFIQKAIDHPDKLPYITPMKLQKLMFFAQSWYLKINNTRLINDEFVRWQYGPVIQSVYYEFAHNGGGAIKSKAKDFEGKDVNEYITPKDDEFIDNIIDVYGMYTGWQLSEATHTKKGAWAMDSLGSVISNEDMINGEV